MVALAIESGVAPSAWWAEDDRDLATALDILGREHTRQAAENGRRRPAEGQVMSSG